MNVELIAVIELLYGAQDIPKLDKYPYWEYPELWDKYNSACYKEAGFKDEFKPYLAGASFYRLSDITDSNLTKLTIDHTQGFREGEYEREQCCTFWGGYVLRIDGQDKYFPQCCGGLADIKYWENLASGKEDAYYEGHPAPLVRIEDKQITLDFRVDELDGDFVPTPKDSLVQFDIASLAKAIAAVKEDLKVFEKRLEKINHQEQLNIDNIGGLLIWDNANYE